MNRTGRTACALVCGLLMQTTAAHAQTAADDEAELALAYGDRQFVSIATGSRQTLARAPAVATVITAEDIAALGATDLDEVLETVPGLHVSRSANNYAPLYVVRGIVSQFTPQVLLLQNGVPMTTLFIGNKGNIWSGYPLEHIARIEVIRGPGSALHGADAYSGVINLITKTAADTPGTETGLRAGSFRTQSAWVQHGGRAGIFDVAAYVRVGRSDGLRERIDADAQSRFDRLAGTAASLAPGPLNTGFDAVDANLDIAHGGWRLRAGYKLRDDVGTGAGIASALDPVGRQRSERITTDLSWEPSQIAPHWGAGARLSFLHYTQQIPVDFRLFPPGANLGTGIAPEGFIGGPDTWERQIRFSAYATYTGFTGHSLRIGAGHDDLDLYRTRETRNFTYAPNGALLPLAGGALVDFSQTTPFMWPQRRRVDYLYVQDEWAFARDWTLTAGLRHDRYSDFGGSTNPRLALVWDATANLTAKLLHGRAFRAPAFNEVYGITNPVALGNPNLRPETIGTTEAAATWQARRDLRLQLSLFRYRMEDIIRNVGGTYANTGAQRGHGGELEAAWDAGRDLRLSGAWSWQRARDEASGRDPGYAPRHHIHLRADWRLGGRWQASVQVNHVADRQRPAGDLRPAIADATTLDLAVRSAPPRAGGWTFAAGVRNLFDADTREPTLAPGTALPGDLPVTPRTLYLQAVHRL